MLDPGFWELVVIAILALLVIGPERLPAVARKVGSFVGKARGYITSVRSDIERELRTSDLERMLKDQNSEIQELKDILHDTARSTSEAVTGVEKALSDVTAPDVAEANEQKVIAQNSDKPEDKKDA